MSVLIVWSGAVGFFCVPDLARCWLCNFVIFPKPLPSDAFPLCNNRLAETYSRFLPRLERLKKGKAKTTEEGKRNEVEAAALAKIVEALEDGRAARTVDLEAEEKEAGRTVLEGLEMMGYASPVF